MRDLRETHNLLPQPLERGSMLIVADANMGLPWCLGSTNIFTFERKNQADCYTPQLFSFLNCVNKLLVLQVCLSAVGRLLFAKLAI